MAIRISFRRTPAECAKVLSLATPGAGFDTNFSGYVEESASFFYEALPDRSTGACPGGTVPVYRLWNQRLDSNHRYTADAGVRDQMLSRGYALEGYGPGPNPPIMCSSVKKPAARRSGYMPVPAVAGRGVIMCASL